MKIFINVRGSVLKVDGKNISNSTYREEVEAMKEGSTITILSTR